MAKPQPLTDADDLEEIRTHEPERLTTIGGQTYNVEDLFTCSCCGEHALEDFSDEEGQCEDCAQENLEERKHQKYLHWWYDHTRM